MLLPYLFDMTIIHHMKMTFFTRTDSLYTIVTKYPETLDIFAANGFPQLRDPRQLSGFGKLITFEAAMKAKKKNSDIFMQMLYEVIQQQHLHAEEGIAASSTAGCSIAGILPCPVKLPLIDSFKEFAALYQERHHTVIDYQLQSASGGLSWLEEIIRSAKDEDDIPDLSISAGFELFFDRELIGKYGEAGTYKDLSGLQTFNSCFDGLDLKDTRGHYSILAGVPAVFLVDTLELKGRKRPESWDDLLSEEFRGSISLPVEDLDLFNAVCLTLYKRQGAEAIRDLGRNMMKSMHPAQMVKSSGQPSGRPAVTVLPWFFTRMIFSGTSLEVIWPKDGSILSPIFIAAKASKEEELKEIVHYFESRPVAQLMREKGYFPCVNPEIDNGIPADHTFQWLGWEFIYEHDIGALIKECTDIFTKEAGDIL